jgi:tetraprenyl-beta-curcumene synthase
MVKIPVSPSYMAAVSLGRIVPRVHRCLHYWQEVAAAIPDPELRKQALASIEAKAFHCEGGAVYAILAGERSDDIIRFIVAYQTISDYLDNLCDRSTSLDPADFEALHGAMADALSPGTTTRDYYRFRKERDDGGYLTRLVEECRSLLSALPSCDKVRGSALELEALYSQVQEHKHVAADERVGRLEEWFRSQQGSLPDVTWYEFAASTGSTLGIFCLVAAAADRGLSDDTVGAIARAYFPWVQGLHILMDYFIDREEDRNGGDLNFCSYYPDEKVMVEQLIHFLRRADHAVRSLPHRAFHRMVCHGLPAMYLGDRKLDRHKAMRPAARRIIRAGGWPTLLFFLVIWTYRRLF